MRPSAHPDATVREQPGYFKIGGNYHLYTVLHEVAAPVARVLLIGPFSAERHHSYIPWVRWARYLAARNIEVLRFDYRGVGESTGLFENMTLSHWMDDVAQLAGWLRDRSPNVPIFLHGLSLGALLAGRSFHAGLGDGLMMWSPPPNAGSALKAILVSWVTLQGLSRRADEHKPLAHYIAELESKGSLEISGYRWSAKLWREAWDFKLPEAISDAARSTVAFERPIRLTTLGKQAVPLVKGGVGGYEEANDLNWLFSVECEWFTSVISLCKKDNYEIETGYASPDHPR